MKLSELESLVALMRAKATEMGNDNPTVEFYEGDRAALNAALEKGCAFVNMDVHPSVAEELQLHVVVTTGSVAKRGDFAIPLQLV